METPHHSVRSPEHWPRACTTPPSCPRAWLMYIQRNEMGDFFTGMTYGDQLEMGTAVVGGGMDHETLNAMIRQEMDERALATQVQ